MGRVIDSGRGNGAGQGAAPSAAAVISVADLAEVYCDECEGLIFRERYRVYPVPALLRHLVGGNDVLQVQVYQCLSCGHVFGPSVLPAGLDGLSPFVCECGQDLAERGVTARQLSAVISPTGRDERILIPVYVFACCHGEVGRVGGESAAADPVDQG